MTQTLDILKYQSQHLTSEERVDLAAFLLDGIDSDVNVEQTCRAEVARRVADIRSGAVTGRPLDEVLAELCVGFPGFPSLDRLSK